MVKMINSGMVWGGMREEGSGWGTHVYLWQIHFDIWQNQYNIVKLNKIKKIKITVMVSGFLRGNKKKKSVFFFTFNLSHHIY